MRRPLRADRDLPGFTLIGVLVATLVLGILAVVATPALMEMMWEVKLKQAARDTAAALRSARYQAITQAQQFGVRVETSLAGVDQLGRTRITVFQGPAVPGVDISVFDLPGGIVLQGPGDSAPNEDEAVDGFDDNDWVIFDPDGSAGFEGGYRLHNPNGHFMEVRVAPVATGRIRLRTWETGEGGGHWKDV